MNIMPQFDKVCQTCKIATVLVTSCQILPDSAPLQIIQANCSHIPDKILSRFYGI